MPTSSPNARDKQPLGAPDVQFHALLLVLATGVIGLSCILQVRGGTSVEIPLVGYPLPGTCTYQQLFGVNCPGCGLTRSFVCLGHLDWRGAWRFNPAGLLGFAIVALQIPYRAAQLWRVRRGQAELRWGRIGQWLLGAFILALFVQWGARF